MAFEELRIPTPWGHLAAKGWGPKSGLPILAVHGLLDNAGSFDTLAPLLAPAGVHLVCLEFWGHGLSSPPPPGVIPNYLDQIYQMKFIMEHLGWKKVILIGHSKGFNLSMLFNAAFPELVGKIIGLDMFKPRSVQNYPQKLNHILTHFQKVVSKIAVKPSKSFTYLEARENMIKNYEGSIDENDADVLLVRGLRQITDVQGSQQEDQFEYSWDPRSTIATYIFAEEQLVSVAQSVTCPLLLIKPDEGMTLESKEVEDKFYDIYRKSSKDFRLVKIKGRHHVHLSNPDRVAPHIIKFLSTRSSL